MKQLIDYQFQADAESRLIDMIVGALNSDVPRSDSNNILFSSCVASGKTKMMASVMRQVAELEEDVAFVFMTLSKGQLDVQALADLRGYGEDVVRFLTIEELVAEASSDGCVPPNTCTVIGWDSVGKDTNIQMRDGERPTFRSVMQENRENGRIRIVLFVDEAHTNLTWKGDAVKRLIHPYAIVMATATPRMKRKEFATSEHRVIVEPDDVAAAGKIKSTVIVNDGELDGDNVLVTDFTWRNLIDAGMRRRQMLENEYAACGLDIIPLVVIQLPNDIGGSDREKRANDAAYVSEAKRILVDELGYDRSDIAVWTAKERDNTAGSELRTNGIKALITKLAITTGWDCPRAQVLVKLRHASQGSETLDMQTLGRIYRTADPVAWLENEAYRTNTDLNSAWIYCDDESYDPSDSGLNIQWNKLATKIRPEFSDELSRVNLVRIIAGQKRMDSSEGEGIRNDIIAMLNDRMPFDYEHQTNGWDYKTRTRQVAQGRHGIEMWQQMADNVVSDTGNTHIDIAASDIEEYVITRIKLNRSIRQYSDIITSAIRMHVLEHLYDGEKTFGEPDDIAQFERKLVDVYTGINNAFSQDFVPSVISIIDSHSHFASDTVYDGSSPEHPLWVPPKSTFLSNKPIPIEGNRQYERYAYDMSSTDSKQEKSFISGVLSKKTNWWMRNGTNTKDSFCISYVDGNGNKKTFYPDFIAKKGKRLLILEVKGDVDGKTDNAIESDVDACKARAISDWLSSKWKKISIDASPDIDDIIFGIVRKINRDWHIYTGDGSDYSDTAGSSWKQVHTLI